MIMETVRSTGSEAAPSGLDAQTKLYLVVVYRTRRFGKRYSPRAFDYIFECPYLRIFEVKTRDEF